MMKKKDIFKALRRVIRKEKKLPKKLNILDQASAKLKVKFTTPEEVVTELILHVQKKSIQRVQADPEFKEMGAIEQLLSYYFVWAEELDERFPECRYLKSYFIKTSPKGPRIHPHLADFFNAIIADGLLQNEFHSRMIIQKSYPKILAMQQEDLLRFYWMNKGNMSTLNAYIEKSVHLSTQLLQENFLDQAFGLFQIQAQEQINQFKFWS